MRASGSGGEESRGARRQDRGGGRRRAEGGRAAEQLLPLLDVDGDAELHAGEGRAAVPEGLADDVGADGRERADAQRPFRRRVLHLRVGAGAEPAQVHLHAGRCH